MLNVLSDTGRRAALRPTLLSGTALLGATLFSPVDPMPANAAQQFLKHGSLVISSTTYDKTQGAVATLRAGVTKLPNSATATTTASAGNG